MFEYDQIRRAYAFLKVHTCTPIEDRIGLVVVAINMYLRGENKRTLTCENYECRHHTEGKRSILGTFIGQIYIGEIENEQGRKTTSGPIAEKILERLN